jgi:hypothetical protein
MGSDGESIPTDYDCSINPVVVDTKVKMIVQQYIKSTLSTVLQNPYSSQTTVCCCFPEQKIVQSAKHNVHNVSVLIRYLSTTAERVQKKALFAGVCIKIYFAKVFSAKKN